MPKFSIIIPVYNAEKYLEQCLDSALGQTLSDIEVICINDGSTDSSLSILRAYAQKDKRIFYLSQENQGLSCARNVALKRACGEYILFLDSDDYLQLDACEILYHQATRYSLDMLSYSAFAFDDLTSQSINFPYYDFTYLPHDFNTNVFNYKDCYSFMHQMAVTSGLTVYRRDFIEFHHISFQPHLCFEDNLFFYQAFTTAERCGIITDKLYYKRFQPSSITHMWHKYYLDYLKMAQLLFAYFESISMEEKYMHAYKNYYSSVALQKFNSFEKKDQRRYHGSTLKYLCLHSPHLISQLPCPSFGRHIFSYYQTKRKIFLILFGFRFSFKKKI